MNPIQQPQYSIYTTKHSSNFAVAAVTLGVIAILSSSCFFLGIPCGAMSIICALLSRGGEWTYPSLGKIGLTLGIIALILSIVLCIFEFYTAIGSFGGWENYWKQVEEYSKQIYGMQ